MCRLHEVPPAHRYYILLHYILLHYILPAHRSSVHAGAASPRYWPPADLPAVDLPAPQNPVTTHYVAQPREGQYLSPALCGATEGTLARAEGGGEGGGVPVRTSCQPTSRPASVHQATRSAHNPESYRGVSTCHRCYAGESRGRACACRRGRGTCAHVIRPHVRSWLAALLALWSRARWGDCQIGSNDLTARGPPSRPRLVRVPR